MEKPDKIIKHLKHCPACKYPEDECSCEINGDTDLFQGGYLDSFSVVALAVFLEKTFRIKIPERELTVESIKTVNKIIELVDRLSCDR